MTRPPSGPRAFRRAGNTVMGRAGDASPAAAHGTMGVGLTAPPMIGAAGNGDALREPATPGAILAKPGSVHAVARPNRFGPRGNPSALRA